MFVHLFNAVGLGIFTVVFLKILKSSMSSHIIGVVTRTEWCLRESRHVSWVQEKSPWSHEWFSLLKATLHTFAVGGLSLFQCIMGILRQSQQLGQEYGSDIKDLPCDCMTTDGCSCPFD
jgi:hypothetical protein